MPQRRWNRFGASTLLALCISVFVAGCETGPNGTTDIQTTNAPVDAPATNTPPVANAGASQRLVVGTTVTLDARNSSDVDADPLAYSWSLTSVPAGSTATLFQPDTATPSFVVDAAGIYTVALVVRDGKSGDSTTLTITAYEGNAPPIANAGAEQRVLTGTLVTLNGAGSSDANSDPLTYAWTLSSIPSGSSAALTDATSPRPSFTADIAGTYVATLTVSDGIVNSESSSVMVTVAARSVEPDKATPEAQVIGAYGRHDNSQAIPYYINLGAYENAVDRADLIQGIRKAFEHIDAHPSIGLNFAYQGTTNQLPAVDAMSVVYLDSDRTYVPGSGGVTFNYSMSGTQILSADIAINGPRYATSPYTNLYELTLHELCHFLGLAHSSTGTDSAVFNNTVNLQLSPDDVAKLATIYPNLSQSLLATTGTIQGKVTRANGLPFSARLVAYDASKTQPRIITADTRTDGTFDMPGLPPGTYRLIAETNTERFVHRHVGDLITVAAGDVVKNLNATITDFGAPLLLPSPNGEAVAQTSHGRIYAIGDVYGPLVAIDATNGAILRTLNQQADDLGLTFDQKRLVVVDQIGRRLYVVDVDPASASYFEIIGQVLNLPSQPTNVAVLGNDLAYVSTNNGFAVVAVNLKTLSVLATIQTGKYNQGISLSKDGRTAYVGTYWGLSSSKNGVIEIDIDPASPTRHTIKREISVGNNGAWYVEASPVGDKIFVGTMSGIDVLRASDYRVVEQIPGGRNALRFTQSSDGQYIAFLMIDAPDLRNDILAIVRTSDFQLVASVSLGGGRGLSFVQPGFSVGEFIVTGASGVMVVKAGPGN